MFDNLCFYGLTHSKHPQHQPYEQLKQKMYAVWLSSSTMQFLAHYKVLVHIKRLLSQHITHPLWYLLHLYLTSLYLLSSCFLLLSFLRAPPAVQWMLKLGLEDKRIVPSCAFLKFHLVWGLGIWQALSMQRRHACAFAADLRTALHPLSASGAATWTPAHIPWKAAGSPDHIASYLLELLNTISLYHVRFGMLLSFPLSLSLSLSILFQFFYSSPPPLLPPFVWYLYSVYFKLFMFCIY